MNIAVACAHDLSVLESVSLANEKSYCNPILYGKGFEIQRLAEKNNLDISNFNIVDCDSDEKSCEMAVKAVRSGEAGVLMKGLVNTSIFLKSVLNKEWGIRAGKTLSHILLTEVETYPKKFLITDGGINVNPDISRKIDIVKNSILVSKALGNALVKVAIVSANEKVSEAIPSTIEAAKIVEMAKSLHFGKNVIIEGPMAIDLVYSKQAALHKGVDSVVSGDADILVFSNIEAANSVAKTLIYMAGAKGAGIIMGASKPIVLASRSSSAETKLRSIEFGIRVSKNLKN